MRKARAKICVFAGEERAPKRVDVDALLLGEEQRIALHRAHDDRDLWEVTHVPTGRSVLPVPGAHAEKPVALAYAAFLARAHVPATETPREARKEMLAAGWPAFSRLAFAAAKSGTTHVPALEEFIEKHPPEAS